MALRDFCNTTPIQNPADCADVQHNWNKLTELHQVVCCISEKEVFTSREVYVGELEGTDTLVIPVTDFQLVGITERKLIDVEWNGLDQYYQGESDQIADWRIDVSANAIIFNMPLGSVGNPCTVVVKQFIKTLIGDLIDC